MSKLQHTCNVTPVYAKRIPAEIQEYPLMLNQFQQPPPQKAKALGIPALSARILVAFQPNLGEGWSRVRLVFSTMFAICSDKLMARRGMVTIPFSRAS